MISPGFIPPAWSAIPLFGVSSLILFVSIFLLLQQNLLKTSPSHSSHASQHRLQLVLRRMGVYCVATLLAGTMLVQLFSTSSSLFLPNATLAILALIEYVIVAVVVSEIRGFIKRDFILSMLVGSVAAVLIVSLMKLPGEQTWVFILLSIAFGLCYKYILTDEHIKIKLHNAIVAGAALVFWIVVSFLTSLL